MKPFRDMQATALGSNNLKQEMREHGYVLIRGLLSVEDLRSLLAEIAEVLRSVGWLVAGSDLMERVADPAAACSGAAQQAICDIVFRLQSVHALPHHASLQSVMRLLVGDQLLIQPRPVPRLVFPNLEHSTIGAHQDHRAIAGDEESFIAWVPLHDCPPELGPLRILEGSHCFGLQPTVGKTGYIAPGTERGSDWVTGEVKAGDVLLFHSLTVHAGTPNRSDRLRVSLDFRFQSYERAVNPGTLVFAGIDAPSWNDIYAGWNSDRLKYYWTKLPLRLKPTLDGLAELARTHEDPDMRARYGRILERLQTQVREHWSESSAVSA